MDLNSKNLGKDLYTKKSIFTEVNINAVELMLINGIEQISHYQKKNPDIYGDEIISNLLKNKKLIYRINKHEEIFINNQKNDLIKIFKYLKFRYKFYLCGNKKIDLGYPPYVLIEPVSTCNLRCPFCFQTDRSFTKKPFMGVINLDLFKKIVTELNELEVGAVTLGSRGEPTLHKNLDEMLSFLSKQENIFEIKINTNASFLNEKQCHTILKNNVTQVVISADHYQKEEYERLRLGANFEKIIHNVDLLYSIRTKHYPNSITEIRISGIDNERNLDRKKFHDFWIKRSDHVAAGYPMERWNTYENAPHQDLNDPCELLWDRMYIWFDGKVNPCDADYKSYLSYGNVKDATVKEIWADEKLKKLRDQHLSNNRNKVVPCDRCGATFCK